MVLNELVDAPFQWFGFVDVLGPLSTAIRVPVADCIVVEVLRLGIDIHDDIHVFFCFVFHDTNSSIYIHRKGAQKDNNIKNVKKL